MDYFKMFNERLRLALYVKKHWNMSNIPNSIKIEALPEMKTDYIILIIESCKSPLINALTEGYQTTN